MPLQDGRTLAVVADVSGHAWARSYALELERVDFRFLLAKTVLSGFLVAVQGDPTSPAAKNSFIDYGQAVNQTVAQSTAMVDAQKQPAPVQAGSHIDQPLPEANRAAVAAR